MASCTALQASLRCCSINKMEQALLSYNYCPSPFTTTTSTATSINNSTRSSSFKFMRPPMRRRPLNAMASSSASSKSQGNAQPDSPPTALQQQQQHTKNDLTSVAAPTPSSLTIFDHWDPFRASARTLRQMMDVMDSLFDEISIPSMDPAYMRTPWDVVEDDESYQLRIDLPGFEKDEVKVHVEDEVLVVNAQQNKEDTDDKQGKRSLHARGSLCTKVALPKNVEVKKLSAKLGNGVLEIDIPKTKVEKHVIDVKLE